MNAQGEDVVAGVRTPLKLNTLGDLMPEIYAQLEAVRAILELHYREMQDLEFTIERGKLYMLQCRTGKRSPERRSRSPSTQATKPLMTPEEAQRLAKKKYLPAQYLAQATRPIITKPKPSPGSSRKTSNASSTWSSIRRSTPWSWRAQDRRRHQCRPGSACEGLAASGVRMPTGRACRPRPQATSLRTRNALWPWAAWASASAGAEYDLSAAEPGNGIDAFADLAPRQLHGVDRRIDDQVEEAFEVFRLDPGDGFGLGDDGPRGLRKVLGGQVLLLGQALGLFGGHERLVAWSTAILNVASGERLPVRHCSMYSLPRSMVNSSPASRG